MTERVRASVPLQAITRRIRELERRTELMDSRVLETQLLKTRLDEAKFLRESVRREMSLEKAREKGVGA